MKKNKKAPSEVNVFLNKSSAIEINKDEGFVSKSKNSKGNTQTVNNVISDHRQFSLDIVNTYVFEEQANVENWD